MISRNFGFIDLFLMHYRSTYSRRCCDTSLSEVELNRSSIVPVGTSG